MHDHTIDYTVNDEQQSTTEKILTPAEIMQRARVNPDQNYLVEIVGHEQKSYRNQPTAEIHMHEHQRFITIFIGPTPVS